MDPDLDRRRTESEDGDHSTEEVTPGMIAIGVIIFVCLFVGIYLIKM